MDDHDPTLNNPALDLEDSDDDAEWNPLKEAEKSGKRKRGGDSSDEEYTEFNNLHNNKLKNKRRAYLEGNSTNSIQNRKMSSNSEPNNADTQVPVREDFKVSYNRKLFDNFTAISGWNFPNSQVRGVPRPALAMESGR